LCFNALSKKVRNDFIGVNKFASLSPTHMDRKNTWARLEVTRYRGNSQAVIVVF
jgi:hypothetical protein